MYTYKVTITNTKGNGSWGPVPFEDAVQETAFELANTWLSQQKLKERRRDIRIVDTRNESFDEADVLSESFENINGEQVRFVVLKAEADYLIEDVTDAVTLQKAKDLRQYIGKTVDQIGDEIIHCIIGFNRQANLTEQQLDDMETMFAPILASLNAYRLIKPKTLIQAIDPATTGGLVTQAMKDEVLAIFTKYGI